MPEVTTDFQSLPEDYQQVIRLAQDAHKITVTPLQLLVGGWSGAIVYLASVLSGETGRVEHCILKLDHKGKHSTADEATRHNLVTSKSTPEFARDHIAELVFERVEHEGAVAIFYRIAGQSLLRFRPLSHYERQSQLRTIFAETDHVLLDEWNANASFEQAVHPQKVLEEWLGFRLGAGGNIERFLQENRGVNPESAGLLINGHVFPNPLLHARKPEAWGKSRSIDVLTGFNHGDLNTNNILVRFAENNEDLDGFYLIDFALSREGMPLLYDQRYLEMSYLLHAMSQTSFPKCVNFLTLLAVADVPDPQKVPVEMSGVGAVIASARNAFAGWVQARHPSLRDDLWGQYWLAGAAAGLAYTHKAGQSDEARLGGLIYAAANLRRFATTFNLPLPTGVENLYDESESGAVPGGAVQARKPKHNLPSQPTPFIGRKGEVTALKDLLTRDPQDVRLVTLTGPGGTGKTRLALQTASELADRFPDGVYFVDLAPIREPEGVPVAIARTVGLKETPDRPLMEEIKAGLRARKMLLLLDNFEQVTAAAPLVGELLQACPGLKMLVTSREALHLRGEHIHPVPPLGLPSPEISQQSLEQLTQYEAVQLFIGRVLAVKPDFEVTNENAPAVAEICFRLDGLPLAIELAAARMRVLSPGQVATRLEDALSLLRGGARDLPLRQQALRDTIDWSYELLGHGEQRLFALLSVFAGCTFEEAEMVARRIPNLDGSGMDILDGLSSLVDKSLIRQTEHGGGEPRLLMLETIREFGAERLEGDAEFSDAARRAHAAYFAEFTAGQWERLIGDRRETALGDMEADLGNLRIAWRYWAVEKDLEQLNKFFRSLWLLYDARGWYHDTVSLTNDLLNVLASTPSTPERAQQEIMLQTSLARALMATKGYTGEAEQAFARALALCESAGEIPQMFPVLRGLAFFYSLRGETEKAEHMAERIVQLAEQLDDPEMKVEGDMLLGYSLAFSKDIRLGLEHMEKAVASYDIQRAPKRRMGLGTYPGVVSLAISALFRWALGYPDRAHQNAADAVKLARKLNHPYSVCYALFHTGLLNLWMANYEETQQHAEALLEVSTAHGFQIWSAVGSCLLGAGLVGQGAAERGLGLIEEGLAAYRGLKTPPVFWPLLLGLCAGAYGMGSKPETGLSLLNEAMEAGSATPAGALASEFLVSMGQLLLAQSPANAPQAESLFQQAVQGSQAADAPMLELRAALKLSRLWHGQGKDEEARKLLGAAYSKMTEGFTTADMQEASALLAELQAPEGSDGGPE